MLHKLRSCLTSPLAQWTAVVLFLVMAGVLRDRWWPRVNALVGQLTSHSASGPDEEHAAHAAHPAGPAPAFIELSPEAMKNLSLTSETLQPIVLSTYRQTISVPALIVERPGQTLQQVSTPMTGVVTEIAAIEGSSVEPGQLLFRMRLTHEDLVKTQTEFVQALGELDVEAREIARLQAVVDSGAVSGKSLLEHRYAKEKLEALLQAQREALRLHGLSVRQVEQISKDKRLLSELTITAPAPAQSSSPELRLTVQRGFRSNILVSQTRAAEPPQPEPEKQAPPEPQSPLPLTVESVQVKRGQSVAQGGQLCVLADYSQLYVEGSAFEQDIEAINKAANNSWKMAALFPGGQRIENLPLAYVASEVDPHARTLRFYVDLRNEILRDTKNAAEQRYIAWRYKPGQRLQLQVPVAEWPNQIVLPLDAVAQDGVDSFVFQRTGKGKFNRVGVHVLHRDQLSVVIANDGSLYPGDVVALRSAHQIQMAIKNKSGGGADAHEGHEH